MEKTVLAPNIRQKWSITTESVQRLPISGQAKTELMVSRTRTMTTKRIADNRDIDALINLLQLQAGEQRKPEELGNYDQVSNAETDSDDDYGDADSLAPDLIPTTGRDRLKYQFLDRIAELVSREKGGRFVRCAVLLEGENKFDVYVSSNNDFDNVDDDLFERFAQHWREAAADIQLRKTRDDAHIPTFRHCDELWGSVKKLSENRIFNTYILNLRSSMLLLPLESLLDLAAFDDTTSQLLHKLYHTLLGGARNEPLSTLPPASTDTLLAQAHELRQRLWSHKAIIKRLRNYPLFAKFWCALCFLGRPREAYLTFTKIIRELPDAQHFKIVLVPRHWAKASSSSMVAFNFQEALKLLPDQGKAYHARTKLRKRWSIARLEKEFDHIRKDPRYLHAEIQMVLHLLDEGKVEEAFPYIGGSKYCCYLCWIFLRNQGVFRTRGCHDHLHHKWLVPGFEMIPAQMGDAVSRILEAFKHQLTSDILSLHYKSGEARPESSAGMMSSVQSFVPASSKCESISKYASGVADLQARRDLSYPDYPIGLAESRKMRTAEFDSLDEDAEISRMRNCVMCDKSPATKCARCESVSYCSKLCQSKDFELHRLLCTSYKTFITSRPTLLHVAGIKLPTNAPKPQLIWIETEIEHDEYETWDSARNMGELLGGGDDVFAKDIDVQYNAKRGYRLHHRVIVFHRDAFLKDGSTTNMTVAALTARASGHDWRGTIILLNRDMHDTKYKDITMSDFRIAVDFLQSYSNYTVQEIEPRENAQQMKNHGVLITCTGDQRELGKAPFIAVDVPPHHLIFRSPDGNPELARLIGIPLQSTRQPPDPVWEAKHDESPNPYRNKAAMHLHTVTNPTGRWWALTPLHWQDNVGSVLVVREDRKPITPRQVQMICAFAAAMQPVFEDSTGAGRIDRSREEVLRLLTAEHFRTFFALFRRKWAAEDQEWVDEKCPV